MHWEILENLRKVWFWKSKIEIISSCELKNERGRMQMVIDFLIIIKGQIDAEK